MAREVHLLRPHGNDWPAQDDLQTEAGILSCLDKERLRDVDKEFLDELDAKQAKLTLKRK